MMATLVQLIYAVAPAPGVAPGAAVSIRSWLPGRHAATATPARPPTRATGPVTAPATRRHPEPPATTATPARPEMPATPRGAVSGRRSRRDRSATTGTPARWESAVSPDRTVR